MKLNREEFLNKLNLVKAGLSAKEYIEQSSCFAFKDGMVMTFNDEIACRMSIGLDITGAVQAAPLIAILEKITDDDLLVRENENNELEFRGKNKGFGITKDADIFLPIDRVELPEKWLKLKPEFIHGIGLVQHCVSTDESRFALCCVHLHPEYVEACDNMQMMRCKVSTGLKESVLVRGSSLKHITALTMSGIALTDNWLHFRNHSGLIFSCRKYAEDYPQMDEMTKVEGHRITIPKGLTDSSDRATVFASDKSGDPTVCVSVKNGVLRILGQGMSGWYKEIKSIKYKGPPMEFNIDPVLLHHIADKYTDAVIGETKLKVSSDDVAERWEYITVLGAPDETEEDEESEEEQPKPKHKRKKASA